MTLNCDPYQTLVPTEKVVTLDTTAAVSLFSVSTLVLQGSINPHPDNVGTVKIGYLSNPENQQGIKLDFCGRSFRYNLADIRVQASNAGDKVIVLSTPYPYN